VFTNQIFQPVGIPADAKIVFVADLFVEDYVGGAELTTQALIDSCPLKYHKVKSQNVTMDLLKQGADKFWIFGNFAGLNGNLIPTIVGNLKYAILEYDYKFCRFRSPEKHEAETGRPCDCAEQMNGKLVSAFYYGASSLWWMSEKQKERYINLFPFLIEKDNIVLSSVFDKQTLGTISALRASAPQPEERQGWIVLGSQSWVKGYETAKKWCEKNEKQYEVVWNLPYRDLLAKLSVSEGFVYLPSGADTCPRMVIEAKLLGCKLQLNDYVQHKDEEWFATDDVLSINDYLLSSQEMFWNVIQKTINHASSISGYTTTYNCVKQNYPFVESIKSMLGFCNEVCVVDGGSTDGTLEALQELASEDQRLKIKVVERDWNTTRFAVFDGQQKAEARSMCTGDILWQMDSDEIVHESDYTKIVELANHFPKSVELIALPVIEYWGSSKKVRVDVNPWKWRISRNNKNITHGIPKDHRRFDENGQLYSAGSDGCDYIFADSYEPVPFISFYTKEVDEARQHAVLGNKEALTSYRNWYESVVGALPGVHHYSWYDIERKIYTYKNYWSKHWTSLFNQKQDDVAENNKFFGRPWSTVTDQEISDLSVRLKNELGGWIFHRHVDFSKPTPWVEVGPGNPAIIENWTSVIEGKMK
jgi:glycosyltransferase involved in cell wall biosynthesis